VTYEVTIKQQYRRRMRYELKFPITCSQYQIYRTDPITDPDRS